MNETRTNREYHAALGHALQDLPPQSVRIDAQHGRGLGDANHHDGFSVHPERATVRDTSTIPRLEQHIEIVLNQHRHSIELQREWVSDARATLEATTLDLDRKGRECDDATKHAADLVATADITDLARTARRGKLSWVSWPIIVLAVIAELVLNYTALGPILGDAAVMTLAAVAAVTLMQVVLVWNLGGVQEEKRGGEYWLSWGAVLIVTVGIAMLRYIGGIAMHEFQRGLALGLEIPSDYSATGLTRFAFLCFSMLGLLILAVTFREARKVHRETGLVAILDARERVVVAEDALNAAAAARVSAEQKVRDTADTMTRLGPQTKAAIRAAGATTLLELEAWYRGMAEGLADPAITANLDARYLNTTHELVDAIDTAVEAGLKELDLIPLGKVDADQLILSATSPSGSVPEHHAMPDPPFEGAGLEHHTGDHATLSLLNATTDEDTITEERLP